MTSIVNCNREHKKMKELDNNELNIVKELTNDNMDEPKKNSKKNI